MKYNSWKLMDKIAVAVRTGDKSYRGFTGYVVEAGDEEAIKKAKDWARTQTWDPEQRKHVATNEPEVHIFDNEGFTATIADSAGGSSQGGRLSFWRCEVEKDGVKFSIGVNDEILAGLIKSSEISNGTVKQKVMFARKQGQPGLIHEGMQMYQEAVADMKKKADLKSAKKTSKWEIGGVYSTLTQTSICLGEAWDTVEEYEEKSHSWSSWTNTKYRRAVNPKKVTVWIDLASYKYDVTPDSFTSLLKSEIEGDYSVWLSGGKPPARAKAQQLEVNYADLELLDKVLAKHEVYTGYNQPKIANRYVRELS